MFLAIAPAQRNIGNVKIMGLMKKVAICCATIWPDIRHRQKQLFLASVLNLLKLPPKWLAKF